MIKGILIRYKVIFWDQILFISLVVFNMYKPSLSRIRIMSVRMLCARLEFKELNRAGTGNNNYFEVKSKNRVQKNESFS